MMQGGPLVRERLVEMFHEVAKQKESRIVEGHVMADHVHMCISIPPKYVVSNVVGFIKGKSAISIARNVMGRRRNSTGESFCARGYFASMGGWTSNSFGNTFGDRNRRTNVWISSICRRGVGRLQAARDRLFEGLS